MAVGKFGLDEHQAQYVTTVAVFMMQEGLLCGQNFACVKDCKAVEIKLLPYIMQLSFIARYHNFSTLAL